MLNPLAEMATRSVQAREMKIATHRLHDGGSVAVIASGPSAAKYTGKHDAVIALNSAILAYPQADVWLTAEDRIWQHEWFWRQRDYQGIIIAEKYMGVHMPAETVGGYPADLWERVIWTERVQWEGQQLADWYGPKLSFGLAYVSGEFDPIGSVSLQGLHLAATMIGPKGRVDSWGMEFNFPAADEQHVNGYAPYRLAMPDEHRDEADKQTLIMHWRRERDQLVLDPTGKILSTPYFVKSAAAIRAVLTAQHGPRFTDHSAGLLGGLHAENATAASPVRQAGPGDPDDLGNTPSAGGRRPRGHADQR